MASAAAKCPYCRAPYTPAVDACSRCGEAYPWANEINELRDQIKEREISRLRSTATLVEEVIAASRGGKPVSVSAIKGFITAWILPRTMIVLGSVLGAAILGVQTYILWNQTQVMTMQTKAAQFEQSAVLRIRISETARTTASLSGLEKVFAIPIQRVYCVSDECRRSYLGPTFKLLREDVPQPPYGEARNAWASLSKSLQQIQEQVSNASGTRELNLDEKQPSKLALIDAVFRPATVQCRFDPDKSAVYINQASTYFLVVGNGFWMEQPLNSPKQLVEFSQQFPQVKSNHDTGLIELEAALARVPYVLTRKAKNEEEVSGSYTISKAAEDLEKLRRVLADQTKNLLRECKETSEQDKRALLIMDADV